MAAEPVAEFLPADHPAWSDVEFLFRRGGLDGLPLFTRPLPRTDIAAALLETLATNRELAGTPPARRLARELRLELAELGGATEERETSPLFEWQGPDYRVRAQAELRLRATVTGDEGEIPPGTRGGFSVRAYLPGGGFVTSDISLEKIVDENPLGDSIVKESPWYTSTNETYASFRTSAVDIAFGQLKNRWGEGASGTLMMSDAALAVPGLQFARTLGDRVRVVAFTGALHHPENRWVSAHRVEIAVLPSLRVGLQEAAVYFSSGLDPLYVVGVIPFSMVQRLHDRTASPDESVTPHRNNVFVGIDVAWRPLPGWQVDGELLVDDLATESSSQPDRIGYLGGVAWSGFLLGDTADFRAEFAKVYRYTYSVFYEANLVQDGVPLGYGNGPDVEHAQVHLERDLGRDLRIGFGWERTRKGEGAPGEFWDISDGQTRGSAGRLSGVVERRQFPHARAQAHWRDAVTFRAEVGVLQVDNLRHQPGDDQSSAHGRFAAHVQW